MNTKKKKKWTKGGSMICSLEKCREAEGEDKRTHCMGCWDMADISQTWEYLVDLAMKSKGNTTAWLSFSRGNPRDTYVRQLRITEIYVEVGYTP